MKRTILILLIIMNSCTNGFSQNNNPLELENIAINLGEVNKYNEDFEDFHELDSLLDGVEIVMLGEQTHGDGTTFETKIKLIKYLHQNLGFDILAFETGIFDCHKAWQEIQNGKDVREAFGKSVQSLWSTKKELIPLTKYIENSVATEVPLELMGFDNQHYSNFTKEHLLNDLSKHLKKISPEIIESQEWTHLKNNFNLMMRFKIKEFKKNNPQQDTIFINHLKHELELVDNKDIWIHILESVKSFISDVTLGTDFRDRQMADNLTWIKESNPNRKIICWGASSHFLYNSMKAEMSSPIIRLLGGNYYKKQTMMGDYIKKRYGNKLFTIGFTAYEGTYGLNRTIKLKPPKKNSIEYILGKFDNDNFLIPLNGFTFEGLQSRPLGNRYMKTDIAQVMDAVVFNRYMRRPKLDNNFFLKIYPDNKYIKPTPTE